MKKICLLLLALCEVLNLQAQASLEICDFKIMPGETKDITIDMANTVEIRALQLQIVLPNGLSLADAPILAKERLGTVDDGFGGTISAAKSISYNKWEDGSYVIMINADDGVPFFGNNGPVISLKVKADEVLKLGTMSIALRDIELVYRDGETYIRPQDTECSVSIYQMWKLATEVNPLNRGTVIGGGDYEQGTEVVLTAKPVEGYAFIGWSDGTLTNPYEITINENNLLIANFAPCSYGIFYKVDGKNYETEYVTFEEEITPLPFPIKEGHTFSGWSEIPATMPAKDVTVTGTFTANCYKVTYILDGETFNTETVTYGTAIPTPKVPAKPGYNFSGWGEIPATMPSKDLIFTGSYTINKDNKFNVIYMVDGMEYKRVLYAYTDAIIIEATPVKEGYTFSGWSEIPENMPLHDVTVEGTFSANKYAVVYTLDGEIFRTDSVTFGTAIVLPEAPAKEGHTFAGWSETPETMPAKDVTVTGTFSANKYAVIYTLNGETLRTDSVTFGTAIVSPDAPAKEGHTFAGWSETPETMPAKDVTVTGSYTVNQYTLTYKVDDAEYKKFTLDYGATITAEAEPTKEGHTFSGWSEIPATMPAKDVTITGSYTVNQYTLTYMVDNAEYKKVTLDYGTTITAEAEPTKEGHTFSGWSELPETMPAKDVTVTGSYTINQYTLTYMVDNAEYKKVTLDFGTAITAEAEPTKEGHTFSGWSEVPATMPAKDVTVTGSYTVNQYTLTYKVNDTEYKKFTLDYGATITAEAEPTKEGHTFSGWSEVPATMPAKDVTVVGAFTVNSYQVTYVLDGTTFKTEQVTFGAAIPTPEVPAKPGYNFSGWGEVPATMPAKDITLNGSYTINKDNKYNIVYLIDGVEYKRVQYAYGDAVTAESEPTKEGYTFSGWSEIPATMPLHDVTIVGEFTVNRYTLTYVVDGEVFATEEVQYGAAITLKDAPTKKGYIFSGWSEVPVTMPAMDIIITGTFSVDGIDTVVTNQFVDVYTLQGMMVKRQIPVENLEKELPSGIYIVGGKKMIIR